MKNPMKVQRCSYTPIMTHTYPNPKVEYFFGGGCSFPLRFPKNKALFLVGVTHNKLNSLLSACYNKLIPIFVSTCRRYAPINSFARINSTAATHIMRMCQPLCTVIVQVSSFVSTTGKSVLTGCRRCLGVMRFTWNSAISGVSVVNGSNFSCFCAKMKEGSYRPTLY